MSGIRRCLDCISSKVWCSWSVKLSPSRKSNIAIKNCLIRYISSLHDFASISSEVMSAFNGIGEFQPEKIAKYHSHPYALYFVITVGVPLIGITVRRVCNIVIIKTFQSNVSYSLTNHYSTENVHCGTNHFPMNYPHEQQPFGLTKLQVVFLAKNDLSNFTYDPHRWHFQSLGSFGIQETQWYRSSENGKHSECCEQTSNVWEEGLWWEGNIVWRSDCLALVNRDERISLLRWHKTHLSCST